MNATSKCLLAAGALALIATAPASAERYKDYAPGKGVWELTTVKVQPGKIDDYLVGLKKSWVPGEEMLKKEGVIDKYFVMTKVTAADGQGNVMMGEHYTSFSKMDPNKARFEAIKKAMEAQMSKKEGDAIVAGYDKYRTFVGDAMWTPVDFSK